MMVCPVTCVMTTWFDSKHPIEMLKRYEAAKATARSWLQYLELDEEIFLHIADDGTDKEILNQFKQDCWRMGWGDRITMSQNDRKGVGASLNKGFSLHMNHHVIFYGVDDWSLPQGFDLNPWVSHLIFSKDIGMIRLGPPHPNLRGTVEHLGELGWGLRLDKYSYAYGQRPALYHRRFIDAYGWFPEGKSAIDCEREYSERVNSMEGPAIMLALPHPWQHIYTTSLSDLTP